MAAIFNDVLITYNGKQYTVKPTFEMINKIEQPEFSGGLGISLAGLSARSANGQVAVTEVARIMALMLRSQVCDVTDGDMYVALMACENMQELLNAVLNSFFPVVKSEQESENTEKPSKKK